MSKESFSSSSVTKLQSKAEKFLSIPNWLTFLRLALIPIFVLLMIDPSREMVRAATAVFIIAAFTDYADGVIARKWGLVSDFGKLLDPLADKILVMAALVMLVSQRSDVDGRPWVPGALVVLVLAREIWVTGLRAVAASHGTIVPAGSIGKLKSGAQMLAIVLLLLHEQPFTVWNFRLTCELAGLNLLIISVFLSYLSAFEYTYSILFMQKQNEEIIAQIKAFEKNQDPPVS